MTLIGGGAFGALINEWFHRRRARTQPIPLIERVNRQVSSELKGFVLARAAGEGPNKHLEPIQNVREYQLTLRNTSQIHLHNAELQFEFPSEDVEGRAERPARSKTAPVPVEAKVSTPWKAGFRWLIPEFPPGDSMEFTFRSVNAPSDEYVAALYGGGQVIVEKSTGEPMAKASVPARSWAILYIVSVAASLAFCGFVVSRMISDPVGSKATYVDWAGCSLNVESSSFQVNSSLVSQDGPWKIDARILNTGSRRCLVKWENDTANPATVEPGETLFTTTQYTSTEPRLVSRGLLFGPDGPSNKAMVKLYERGEP